MIQSMLILLHNSANGNAPTLNNAPQKSLARLDGGCRSLRDNASDFEKGSVSPHNSATTALTCDRWRLTESTALFYDGWELNAEADAQTGNVTAIYLHGANTDEIIARADISNATAPNAVVYYTYDHLGSVRALSNASGNIVESYQYEAFGKPTIFDASGNVIARSVVGNRFMFTGREYLDTIQLYDYRNRTYSPKWGRFIEVDPIRFEGRDLNLYRYVGNWVMELIDPWGLYTEVIYWVPGSGASRYGHISIIVNDTSYSWGPSKRTDSNFNFIFDTLVEMFFDVSGDMDVDSAANYISRRSVDGPGFGLVIPLSEEQEALILEYLENLIDNESYDLLNNNCMHAVRDALIAAGIELTSSTMPVELYEELSTKFPQQTILHGSPLK